METREAKSDPCHRPDDTDIASDAKVEEAATCAPGGAQKQVSGKSLATDTSMKRGRVNRCGGGLAYLRRVTTTRKDEKVNVDEWVESLKKSMIDEEHGGGCTAESWEERVGDMSASAPIVGAGGGVGAPVPPNAEGEAKSVTEVMEGAKKQGAITEVAKEPLQRRYVRPKHWIQHKFLPLVNSDVFFYVVIGAIMINAVQLAAKSPLDDDPQAMQDAFKIVDLVLLITFTVEMVMKHLALFPRDYWKDNWNRLDGTIVIVGYFAFIPGFGDFPAIRVLRIIRPLRVINKLNDMKKIISTLINAAIDLSNTFMLCGLIFFMFGIVGCTLFAGSTRTRCFIGKTVNGSTTYTLNGNVERPCSGDFSCPGSQKCFYHDAAPSYSIVSFDNILIGFLNLFTAITLEGWVDVMYLVQDGYGYWAACIFFHLLILLGSLFVLNLALAVISEAYDNQDLDFEMACKEASAALEDVMLIEEAGQLDSIRKEAKRAIEELLEEQDEKEPDIKICAGHRETIRAAAAEVRALSDKLLNEEGCENEDDEIKDAIATVVLAAEPLEIWADEQDEEDDEEEDEEDEEKAEARLQKKLAEMHPVQAQIYKVAVSSFFEKIIMLFIIMNTITLAIEHSPIEERCYTSEKLNITTPVCVKQGVKMSTDISDVLKFFNYVFIAVFTMEAVIKLSGLGPHDYVKDRFNIFDFTIVIFSFIELGLAGNSSLSALRTFRLARIFKLAKSWKELASLITTIIGTLPHISYLSILLLLFMFIASVAGMMFFGGQFTAANGVEEDPRHLFDNFGVSMLTVFQMLTGENWNSVMYDGIQSTGWICVPYFLIVQIVGNFVILNLFLAILLNQFGDDDEEEEEEEEDASGGGGLFGMCGGPSAQVSPEEMVGAEKADGVGTPEADEEDGTQTAENLCKISKGVSQINSELRSLEEEEAKRPPKVLGPEDMAIKGRSLYCFDEQNTLRRHLAVFVGYAPFGEDPVNTPFAVFVFVSIMLSSITLAMDGPTLDDESDFKKALNILDVFFTLIFTIEMIMKIIVFGFLFAPEAYLKDGWNVLDFLIVLTSVLALPSNAALSSDAADSPFKSLSMLRAFRALRPLRMINRSPGLKCVMDAIFHCMPAFINIGLVTCLVYLVFAIMGVQLWAGKFWTCSLPGVADVEECVLKGGTWSNKPLNFDDVLNAQLTLFEVSSLEIWLDVMYAAMDVPSKIGEQPVRNQSYMWALYFVVFIVIGSFLMLNLFVGAVVDNFTKIKAKQGKQHALMTKQQEEFIQSIDTMLNKAPAAKLQPPERDTSLGRFQYKVFKLLQYDITTGKSVRWGNAPLFDQVIMTLISMNILVMSAPIWVQPSLPPPRGPAAIAPDTKEYLKAQESDWNNGLETVNTLFNFLFLLEAITKITGLGKKQYFDSPMNVFDFCIVCISLVGFVIDAAVEDVDPSLISVISVIKAGRVIRIFRLAMRVKGIRNLLETLIFTLPSLFNVACLLVIVLFIYTILGMAFFGKQEFDKPPFQLYNAHANFRYFHIGFFTLFRMSTGESWNGIMHDSMEQVSPYAWIFYCSYMIVGSNLLLQLIVAVLLEQFTNASNQEEAPITPDDIAEFAATWKEHDPKGTQFIQGTQLGIFLEQLGEPMGLPANSNVTVLRKFLADTELKVANHRAHYVETFFALVQNVYSKRYRHRWNGQIDKSKLEEMTKQLRATFPSLDENTQALRDGATLDDPIDALSATKIQAVVRKKQASKKVDQKAIDKIGRPLSKSSKPASLEATPRKADEAMEKVESVSEDVAGSPGASASQDVAGRPGALPLDNSPGALLVDHANSLSQSPSGTPSRPLSHRGSKGGLPPISGVGDAAGSSAPAQAGAGDPPPSSPPKDTEAKPSEEVAKPSEEAAAPAPAEAAKPEEEIERPLDETLDETKPADNIAL